MHTFETPRSLRLLPPGHDWFDGKAVEQLQRTANLEGMRRVVGFPDMHPGLDAPNGAAFISEGIFYPHLIGNDIGCGYGLWQTDLPARRLKLERWVQRLHGLDQPWQGDRHEWLAQNGLPPTAHDEAMGTIGGGNHFAELQQIHAVADADAFAQAGLDNARLFVLVHSGSRALGQSVLRAHTDTHGNAGLRPQSQAATEYLARHDNALRWARANRELIARRFAGLLNTETSAVLDLPHNAIEPVPAAAQTHWLHRKGASPAGEALAVVPGSRGALTYLVKPLRNTVENAFSLAHGAGRRWDRHATKTRLRERLRKESLLRTELGGHVICEEKSLLFQEAPQAYKPIEKVIRFMSEAGLIRVIATLRPLITYKKRNTR